MRGESPGDTPAAMRFAAYDLVFVDGLHTTPQLTADLLGIAPFLAPRFVAVLHDVLLHDLGLAVAFVGCHFPAWSYRTANGSFPNYVGTGLFAGGWASRDSVRWRRRSTR